MSRSEERLAKRERWGLVIREWEECGLTQAAFCRERGLAFHQFIYWRKKCRAPGSVSLVEISAIPGLRRSCWGSGLVVRVRDRFGVEVREGFSPDLLRSVVRVLEGI